MTGQIRISPDTMRQRAAEYGVEAENLGAIISKMDSGSTLSGRNVE